MKRLRMRWILIKIEELNFEIHQTTFEGFRSDLEDWCKLNLTSGSVKTRNKTLPKSGICFQKELLRLKLSFVKKHQISVQKMLLIQMQD